MCTKFRKAACWVMGLRSQQVSDVVAVGLKNLTDPGGAKSPLSEYNDAFERLQRRRRMDPIHLVSGSLNSPTTGSTGDSESAQKSSGSESPGLPLNPIISDQIPSSSVLMKENYGGCDDLDIMALEEPDELTQILDDLEHGVHDPTMILRYLAGQLTMLLLRWMMS